MTANVATINVKRDIKLKLIALPIEHGSWGFLLEPLLAGLLLAFSPAGLWISLMVIGAFLTRQPLKVLLSDWLAKRNLPQTSMALKFVLLYSAIFWVGLIGSILTAPLAAFWPFALIAPLAVYQIYCDVSRQSRKLIPELTGAVAISSSVAAIALADGWAWPNALALWAIFVARLIPSILYVRNRLRLEKGKEFSFWIPTLTSILSVILVGVLAFNKLSPVLTVLLMMVLLFRTVLGLSPYRTKMKAMQIGVWEVIYGLLTALSVVIGNYFHL